MDKESVDCSLSDWWSNKRVWTLKPGMILILASLWSYFIIGVHPLFRGKKYLLLFIIALVAARWLYREFPMRLQIRNRDWLMGFLFLAANLVFHWPDLNSDIAGDEAYQAKRAAIVLLELRNLWYQWPALDLDVYRSNHWRWFDFRHLPVVEVWRIVSIPMLVVLVLICAFRRKIFRAPEPVKWTVFLLICFCGAWFQARSIHVPDYHAPLRLLPVFLSTVFLGYNEFALRLPGLVVISSMSAIMLSIMRREGECALISFGKMLLAFLAGAAPAIYYASHGVEASIYGYFFSFLVLWLGVQYLRTRDFNYLLWCSVFTGVGVLARQPVVGLWPVLGVFMLFDRGNFRCKRLLLLGFPLLLNAPYLFRLLTSRHGAVSQELSRGELLVEAFTGGGAISTAISSMSPAWLLFGMILVFIVISGRRHRWIDAVPFIAILPMVLLFFTVVSQIMGAGRYQAEYFGPFLALLLVFVGENLSRDRVGWVALAFVYLLGTTLEHRRVSPQDIRFLHPQQLQGSDAVHFPLRAALTELKRIEANGAFAIVGGQTHYGEVPLWLSGHSYTESIRCLEKSSQVKQLISRREAGDESISFLLANNIRYLVLQDGTRRERTNQSEALKDFYQYIRDEENTAMRKLRSYVGQHGGVLDIYEVKKSP